MQLVVGLTISPTIPTNDTVDKLEAWPTSQYTDQCAHTLNHSPHVPHGQCITCIGLCQHVLSYTSMLWALLYAFGCCRCEAINTLYIAHIIMLHICTYVMQYFLRCIPVYMHVSSLGSYSLIVVSESLHTKCSTQNHNQSDLKPQHLVHTGVGVYFTDCWCSTRWQQMQCCF